MWNKIKTTIMIVALLSMLSCNWNISKNPSQVSKDIHESIEKNVFIREFRFENIETLDKNYQFPFKQAWEEKVWYIGLDSLGKEKPVIDALSATNIVFQLKENEKFFSIDNFMHKWIMKEEGEATIGIGTTSGIINTTLRQEKKGLIKISFAIYKQKYEYDTNNNLTPLFKFNLVSN